MQKFERKILLTKKILFCFPDSFETFFYRQYTGGSKKQQIN